MKEEGQELAKKHNFLFGETSAITNLNTLENFKELCVSVMELRKTFDV